MEVLTTEVFDKGTYNLFGGENIPQSASKDSLGWISTDDAIELSRGRIIVGSEYISPDQVQISQDGSFAFGESDTAGKQYKIAQSFVPQRNELQGVSLYKKASTGTFTGSVTISIHEDSSGSPDGLLTSKVVDWSSMPLGAFDVLFSSNLTTTIGSTYWIVIVSSTGDDSNHPNVGYSTAGVYSSGELKSFNTTNSWVSETGDIYFKTIVSPYVGSTALHITTKADGTEVMFQKSGTTIQYWTGLYWADVLSGLESEEIYTFSDYVSLGGNYTFVGGKSGLWKIPTANPTSPIDVYNSTTNLKGKIRIDRSRMLLWGRAEDKTGLYGSKLDPQDGTVYTTVTGEAVGSSGSTTYTGTLAFKAGGSRRSCFGVVFQATIATGTESFRDDFSGNLTSSQGGTGTINYATGEYSVTFSQVTTGSVTADYQWEDSSVNGIADFRKSGTRIAGEGFIFRQDVGGDEIMQVLIQDGKYYSFKKRSIYEVEIASDDASATNIPYRLDAGILSYGAGTETSAGIIFMNNANPDKPILTTLQRTTSGTILEPVVLSPQFDFSRYSWDKCYMETYGEYVIFSGKSEGSDTNDSLFVYNSRLNITDTLSYSVNTLAKSAGVLYAGSSVNPSVSKILNGFDDDGLAIQNFWKGRDEIFSTLNLKKVKRLQLQGKIGRGQKVEVYIDFDNSGYQLVGTIVGSQDYVDRTNSYAIGTVGIGISPIGGGTSEVAYPFLMEIKLQTPKFRVRSVQFKALSIGYASIEKITDKDVRQFEFRLPKKYRLKQDVSLDGLSTDQ